MKQEKVFEIKHKVSGKVLLKVKAKDLTGADLRWADLTGADLRWANLREADLREAKGEFIFNFGVKLKVVNP